MTRIDYIFLAPIVCVPLAGLLFRFALLRRPFNKDQWGIFSLGLVLAIVFPFVYNVWLPDVLFAPTRTIGEATSARGYNFRVEQYWNRYDFYSTKLHVTYPNGEKKVTVLDGDDFKAWVSVPIVIDEASRIVRITLSEGRLKEVRW